MAELEAARDKLGEELEVLEKEIKELEEAREKAQSMREEEKSENTQAIGDARDGLEAVNEAIDILSKFYKAAANKASMLVQVSRGPADDAPDAGFEPDKGYAGAQGAGGGIIGMLEVIKSDFERTISGTMKAEAKAAKDHMDMMTETGMSLAEKG